ncbi:DUF5081 family protein [Terribacillus saccharophilus]|uniref:DUF5081 family protein n=1 Tax=Terribacillus saccharophilus TaxID=361277 RepID=UPI003981984E
MNQQETDTFHVTELYLLAAAFDAEALFGLPDKKIYQIQGEEPWRKAHEQLIQKGIFTADGKLTNPGAAIIKTLYEYFFSRKYVRINNLMFAFREKKADDVIILAETNEGISYRLYVMAKPLVLKLLGEKLPLVNREPLADEKDFLQRELPETEKDIINELDTNENMVNIELFHPWVKPSIARNANYYQQWLALSADEKLVTIDTYQKKYYHTSQYWFMKLLFDALDFPYRPKEVSK